MLDTWTLRVLVEVGERGSFSAAAEALSMTQPAVSRQIAGLEKRLGSRLFRRVPRGVRATPAGVVAADLARDVLTRLQALERRVGAFGTLDLGELRLSAFPSANTSFVPEAIRRFRAAHPGVTIGLHQVDPAGPAAGVRDGRVDLALLTAWGLHDTTGVELVHLLDEQLLVAIPAGHRLARQDRVRLRDLRDEAWIEGAHPDCLGPIPRLTEALGTAPRIGFTCDDWNGKLALVAGGAGIALVPTLAQTAMHPGVVLRPTSPILPPRRVLAAAAPPPYRAPAATAMLTHLKEVAATLPTSLG